MVEVVPGNTKGIMVGDRVGIIGAFCNGAWGRIIRNKRTVEGEMPWAVRFDGGAVHYFNAKELRKLTCNDHNH